MTIGEVASRAGLNTSHIRYHERVGVLPKPHRISGQRRYDEAILDRLAIIDVAQRAGLTLDEIRYLTGPDNQGPRAGDRIRELAERKLPDVEMLISRAEAVKTWLEVARTCDCRTVDVCSLFTDPSLAPPPPYSKLDAPQSSRGRERHAS
jgi:MerR family transcriptional regulator, redox-sensitive transcriptional activator SoxR